jgi:osmoprotectant transport system substrate-binding protein
VVRESVLEAHPEIEALLNEVFATLDMITLQTLNADVAVNGLSPTQVASDYLDTLDN